MSKIFLDAIAHLHHPRPPVWFMRQAGRYHPHYQSIRKQHSFEQMCKNPNLAAEIALRPVVDFGLDCAILFSDILFFLGAFGQEVSFKNGPPEFEFYLNNYTDLNSFTYKHNINDYMAFQASATQQTIQLLPTDVTMLGFVGGPATLFTFASKNLNNNDLFKGFLDKIFDPLLANIKLQSDAGCEVICIFDSSVNVKIAFSSEYESFLESLVKLAKHTTKKPILFYLKKASIKQIKFLENIGVDVIAIDESIAIQDALQSTTKCLVQGNFNNNFTTLEQPQFESKLNEYFASLKSLPQNQNQRLINSLSHGMLPSTKLENIKQFVTMNNNAWPA